MPLLFTTGQFVKLHNINKRTLHYYDDIQLFSPAHKGENGYRYYTYMQSATLEMLLALRELNMSIEEIYSFMKSRNQQTFREIVENKTAEIDRTITQLNDIRSLLKHKANCLDVCAKSDLTCIDILTFDTEYLLLSKPITGTYDADDFAVLIEHSHYAHGHRLFNKSYGCMISAENICNGNFDSYTCFFTRVDDRHSGSFVKPAGQYIRAFCKGDWDMLPETYRRITDFAEEQGLTLTGYAYEEGLNEAAIDDMSDYVTMITVRCH